MTPDKSKKPLPSSTSVAFPEQPKTLQQWNLALQRVKLLYLKAQWKQCVVRCNQLLSEPRFPKPHPLHDTYLYFYSALSEEAIARQTHGMSMARLQSLEQAKASFQAAASSGAAAAIPSTLDKSSVHFILTPSERAGDSHDMPTEETSSSIDDDPSMPSADSTMTVANRKKYGPLPLNIRNVIGSTNNTYVEEVYIDRSSTVAPAAFQTTPSKSRACSPSTSRPTSITFSESTTTWLHSRAQERYSTLLSDFSDALVKYISDVDDLIRSTKEAQAVRYTVKRMALYREEEEGGKQTDLSIRIARLKADGWKRQRFAPERYQELCAVALAEL